MMGSSNEWVMDMENHVVEDYHVRAGRDRKDEGNGALQE